MAVICTASSYDLADNFWGMQILSGGTAGQLRAGPQQKQKWAGACALVSQSALRQQEGSALQGWLCGGKQGREAHRGAVQGGVERRLLGQGAHQRQTGQRLCVKLTKLWAYCASVGQSFCGEHLCCGVPGMECPAAHVMAVIRSDVTT